MENTWTSFAIIFAFIKSKLDNHFNIDSVIEFEITDEKILFNELYNGKDVSLLYRDVNESEDEEKSMIIRIVQNKLILVKYEYI